MRRLQASLLPNELRPVVGLRASWLVDGMLRCYRYLPGGGNKLPWLRRLLLPRETARQLGGLARAAG